MNIVDIIILGVVGISVIYGFYHGFIHTVEGWYRQMLDVPPAQIMRLIKLGAKVVGLLKFVGGKGDKAERSSEG